jgi:hypothetical protein
MPCPRYGVFTPSEILFNPTPDPARRSERDQRAKGGEKPENGRIVNSVGFLLLCDSEKFGADWQSKARSLRAASNAHHTAPEERDTRPVAKVSCWWFLVSWPLDPVVTTNRHKFH